MLRPRRAALGLVVLLAAQVSPPTSGAVSPCDGDNAEADWATLLETFKAAKLAKAADLATAFIENHPDHARAPRAHAMLCRARFRMGDHEVALAMAGKLLDGPLEARDTWRLRALSGAAHFWLGRGAEARPHLERCLASSECPPELVEQARTYLRSIHESLPPSEGRVLPYAGVYARDDRLGALRIACNTEVDNALHVIARRTGLDASAAHGVRVRLVDGTGGPKDEIATCRMELFGDRLVPVISVDVRMAFQQGAELRPTMMHEVVHCFLLARLGVRAHEIPRWLHEGLADWFSGSGEEFVRGVVAAHTVRAEPGAPVPIPGAIDWASGGASDYVESYLGIVYLHLIGGLDAGTRVMARLWSGDHPMQTIEEVSGLPYAQFVQRADKFVALRLRVEHRKASGLANAVALKYTGDTTAVEAALRGVLEDPKSTAAIVALARCELTETLWLQRKWEEAREQLQRTKREWPWAVSAVKLRYYEVLIVRRHGDREDARRLARGFRNDFPDAPGPYLYKVDQILGE